jgi:uncharacterized protein YqgV (UPF0045/DUF77 family)
VVNASVAIQVLPQECGDELFAVVDRVIAYIKGTGHNAVVGPFETTVEGNFDELMELVKRCQLICIEAGAPGVMSFVKIHYDPRNGVPTIEQKTAKHR